MMQLATGNRERILIVDNEPGAREYLRRHLSGKYDCREAGSVEEALPLLRDDLYDIVISDNNMGCARGLEMIPLVRELLPDAGLIVTSAAKGIEIAVEALRAGAFDYMIKPFSLEQIETVVHRASEHHNLLIAKRRYENHLEELVEQRTEALDSAVACLEDAYRMTLKALVNALETRDIETHGHSERVVRYSLRLGRELGLEETELKSLEFGALLHDIGKIGVSDAILRKPAKLTAEEWVKMREHPEHGHQIVEGIEFLEGASRVIAQHHEKWDGSGYPLRLRGAEIDLNARIFAVIDAYDAMTSDRVYRRSLGYEAAMVELERESSSHFDPRVVAAFRRVTCEEWKELRESPSGLTDPVCPVKDGKQTVTLCPEHISDSIVPSAGKTNLSGVALTLPSGSVVSVKF